MDDKLTLKRPDVIALLTGRSSDRAFPHGISLPGEGGKFATDGSVQQWPGNTFICHVDTESPEHSVLLALQEEVKMSRFAQLFNFLPPASFHMTMFQGVCPETVSIAELPTHATPDMRREALSAIMLDAIKDVTFAPTRKVKMVDVFCAHSVTVTGSGNESESAMRKARETLRESTGIHPPDFDQYVFHITLAYRKQWLTATTAQSLVEFSDDLTQRYESHLSEIPLGAVEFCNFDTMHHFEPLIKLV